MIRITNSGKYHVVLVANELGNKEVQTVNVYLELVFFFVLKTASRLGIWPVVNAPSGTVLESGFESQLLL